MPPQGFRTFEAVIVWLDMDLVLHIEIRFGRVLNNWYVMGELMYGCSLAHETVGFEPCIRVGYNFGKKK